ncbi:MAG TPA: hypothetical protein VGM19_09405 [Armatimonadota bacterium]|jgi:hypothetical protein
MIAAQSHPPRLSAAKTESGARAGWTLVVRWALAVTLACSVSAAAAQSLPRLQQPQLRMPHLNQPRSLSSSPQSAHPEAETGPPPGTVSAQGVKDPEVTLCPGGLHFEKDNLDTPASRTISGEIKGKREDYRLALWTSGCEAEFSLPWVQGPRGVEGAPDIPMSWELRYRCGCEWSAWQPACTQLAEDLPDGASWWVLPANSKEYQFELRCSVQPEPYQAPGHYERRIFVDVSVYDRPGC